MTRRRAAAIVTTLVLTLSVTAARAAEPKEIPITIENNRFSPEEIKVKAGEPFVLVVTNKDKGPEELGRKDVRMERVVPAGKTMKIRVRALERGTYPCIGEYHEATAKGRIVAE